MNLLRTLHVRRRWDPGTSASPCHYLSIHNTFLLPPQAVHSLPTYPSVQSMPGNSRRGGLLLFDSLFNDMLRVPSHPLQYALSLISACGRAPPDRISTYNQSRAGGMLHRYGSVSSTRPQLFPHYYKPNHLPQIEALGRVYAYLPRGKGWVSNCQVPTLSGLRHYFRPVTLRQMCRLFHNTVVILNSICLWILCRGDLFHRLPRFFRQQCSILLN